MKNLANQFSATATENSEKTAIYWGEEHYTFGQAHAVAARLAKRPQKPDFGDCLGDC